MSQLKCLSFQLYIMTKEQQSKLKQLLLLMGQYGNITTILYPLTLIHKMLISKPKMRHADAKSNYPLNHNS